MSRFGSNLAELAAEYEERGEDPLPVYRELGAKGLAGLPFDPAYGGSGRPYREYLDVIEELARSWVALAVGLGVHTLVCDAVQRFATAETKRELLPAMLAGERFGAYALTESSSGSDAASLRTRAKRTDGGYVITGRKQFCTRGGEADHLLVMARTGGEGPKGITAFVLDRQTPGFRPARTERKMAWRSSPTWELVFEDCQVPEHRRLGAEGEGFTIAMAALDGGRLGIAACAVGLAQAACDAAVDHVQAVQADEAGQGTEFMLADMAIGIEAGRALYQHAASLKDRGAEYSRQASMAKLFCTDMAMRVTTDAFQIAQDDLTARFFRESKVLQIVEGTNQIQRVIIGRMLGSEAGL
jgi:alkylation response protein AidB-like acyl-CoA dehydrogenase